MTFRRFSRLEPAHHREVRTIFLEESEKMHGQRFDPNEVEALRVQVGTSQTKALLASSAISEGSEGEVDRDP